MSLVNPITWLWEREGWTDFSFDLKRLQKYNLQFAFNLENNSCPSVYFQSEEHSQNVTLMIQGFEAVTSSEIEGENINLESVIGSMRKTFEEVALHKPATSNSKARRSGIVSTMIDAYMHFDRPLTKETLDHWNELLTADQDDKLETIGDYRKHTEAMHITSTARLSDDSVPSYVAPPSDKVEGLMEEFIEWYNDTGPNGKTPLSPIVRSSLAHLYFVMIHPYEDGNGRMSRILAEKALSESYGKPTLISLSHRISQTKPEYYKHLENAAKFGDTDGWLDYFSRTIIEAQKLTADKIGKAKHKIEIEEKYYPDMNGRQKKLMDRVLNPSENNYPEGITTDKYKRLTSNLMPKGSNHLDVAEQDLDKLSNMGIFSKSGSGKKARYTLHPRNAPQKTNNLAA